MSITPSAATHRIETYADNAGKWRWRMRRINNGRITATSGECFAKRANADRAARAIASAVIVYEESSK